MSPIRILAAVCVFLAAVLASGQTRGGETVIFRGIVLDENGVPLTGVHLKLESTSAQVLRAETDGAGRFTMRDLAAGDYTVEIRKEGFFVVTGRRISLQAGTNDFTFMLNHAEEVHERVQVTAQANQIDPQDTAQRAALTARDIRDVPVANSHVLTESLTALPEVVQDNLNNMHIAGARSGETQYVLDGFEIGDPVTGMLTSRFNVDATRSAEVQTGRIGASYAHSGASVLSLETPDGDDKWRFGTTNPAPGVNVQEGVHLGNWYPRFTFSGPILRGRFWFANSVSLQHNFSVVKEQPRGENTSEEWAGDDLLRVQYNFSPKHVLHGTFLYNRTHDENLGLDAIDPQSTTTTAEQRRSFFALREQVWLLDTLIDFGIAADTASLEYVPQGTQPYLLLVNGTAGNFFERLHQRGQRLQAVANITAASRHWHGTHSIAIGANLAGLTYSLDATRGEVQAERADGTLVRQSTFAGLSSPDVSNTQAGAYAQDTWALSKFFLFQAGLRLDWDRFTHSGMFEPRLSANILPFGDDRSKISMGWGIYNAPLNLSVIGQALDQTQFDTFFDSTGMTVTSGPVASRFVLPDGGLQQPRFQTLSVGAQQKIGRNTLVGVELLARNGFHGLAYVDEKPAQPGGDFLLQSQRKDRYRAATFSVRHSFSENVEVFAAYTRSVAHSNQVLNPNLGSIFYAAQQPGALAWDTPNRFIAWGWAPTHIWSIQLTYFFQYRTGFPYSAINLQQQLVGSPNSLRFPDYASLNLGIEKKFGFRGYLWGIRLEAVNALNRPNPDTVVNNVDAPTFGAFAGGQGRAVTLRVRFIGRK